MCGNLYNNKNFTTIGLDIYFTKKKSKEIGYFRKVNFLVRYFEDLGLDTTNQVPLQINKEDVEILLHRCNQVLEDHSRASELLPTMSGFFFGSTEYNEYYFEDVKMVRDYIKNTLIPEFNNLGEDEEITFGIWY